jgi:hypothetical protein
MKLTMTGLAVAASLDGCKLREPRMPEKTFRYYAITA